MYRDYRKWYSTRLQRDMELLVFGNSGTPLVVFPTEKGRFFDYENFGMIQALAPALEDGALQAFCVDSVDRESWFNGRISPEERMRRHACYECYILAEVVPFLRVTSGSRRFVATGCSFGAYHALNLALRHPELMDGFVSMSGTFNVRPFLDSFWNDACLFLSPLDYIPVMQSQLIFKELCRFGFVLGSGTLDFAMEENIAVAKLLESRGINTTLDICDLPAEHDWPLWHELASRHLSPFATKKPVTDL